MRREPRPAEALTAWQHPFLNVFRHFRVDEWKRSAKQGDVAVVTDKTLKGAVYRIRGSVSAANYIQLPKSSTQSLGLTGRYLYVLFRPLPSKHFVIHLDVSSKDNQVIRVSFSNLFKEFKSTATWLQFPLVLEARTPQRDLVGLAPSGARWTCLQLDLQDVLLVYLNRCYGHLKSIRLCASLLVRNLYTSDLCFEPAISGAQWAKLPVTPMPREMAFPVPKGESWHDRYIHVRFPSESLKVPSKPIEKSCSPPEAVLLGPGPQPLPCPVASSKPVRFSVSPVVQTPSPTASGRAALAPRPFPEVSLSQERSDASNADGPGFHSLEPWAQLEASDIHTAAAGTHVLTHESAEVPVARTGSCEGFLPDPVLRLKGVIGFGGHGTRQALWTPDGAAVVYPCHAVIVVLLVDTGEQRFFLGHTDKVSALALDGSSSLLASAQARAPSVMRLWDFQTGRCLCLFRSPMHVVCSLSFSDSGALLCGVGKDHHGRTMVVAWGTGQVGLGGEVVVLAKAHTDFDVQAFRVTFFDETRMASCGQGSVRLWRLRGGVLRSCPVDLGEHHALQFTDLAFKQARDGCPEPSAAMLFVCSRSGHILEIDCQRMVVRHARRLLPTRTPGGPHPQKQTFSSGPGIAISSLSVSPAMCAVGSEDGFLRLWPLDFSSVLLEAEHEGPVSSVCVSPDGLRVLSATSSGHLGFLDTLSRVYHMLARSHTAPVLALAMEQRRGQLATVSQDRTVRIWDLATLQQLYDFTSSEDAPCAVTFHPTRPTFFCGFSSGAVRSFSLEAAEVLVEHTCHRGAVTGLTATPDGRLLFSSCSQGSLAQYSCADPQWHVLRVAADMVCPDAPASPSALAVSRDGRLLAFVGPSRCTVTVMGSASLDELLRVDIGTLDLASSRLDSAMAVCFGPAALGHLLVSTSSNRVVVLDAVSGRIIRESTVFQLPGVHPEPCPSLTLSEDARFLLIAAGRTIKVWDYATQASPGPQVYIGHSEPVQAVAFSPDQQQVLSAGDAVFLWDVLAPTESDQSFPGAPPACKTGPGAGPLEDAASRASELPRQQVPKPCQASPPRLGVCARPPEGGDGTLSPSDEEGPCEESCDPEGLGQASGPPVLTEEEAGRAGDGAWAAAVGSWGLALPPRSPGQPREQWRAGQGRWCRCRGLRTVGARDTRNSGAPRTTYLASCKAFTPARVSCSPHSAKGTCPPPASGGWLRLKAVVGYSGNGRANMVWRPDTGFFAYTCGRLVVVEDLHSGAQQHWSGHSAEISTLALSHSAQVLASASGRSSTTAHCQIRVWDVSGGLCQHLIFPHSTTVLALAFSPDDRLLVTLGDHDGRTLALWGTATYDLVSSTRLPEPVHGVAFNPWDAGELTCVGQGTVTFWLLQQRGADISLQVRREPVPEAVGAGELTSLCYGAPPLLYCGTSSGQVCVWDTRAGRCFLSWEADDGGIGLLLFSGSRLVSGSSTGRLRLWAVGAVSELRCKGSGARSSSVFMEHELVLDGAVVSASFDDSVDMGVVGTTAGTLWFVSWAEGTSTRLISGHRSKVNEVVFSPGESHCATCSEDGSVRVWALASMELVIQFQVLNQSCLCLAWSPPCCGRPEQQRLAAGYGDGSLRIFSVSRTAMELKMHPHPVALTTVAFSTDGQTVLSGDKDGLVAVSHPCTGTTFRVLSDHQGAPISTICVTCKECEDLGVEGTDLWLAASGDQRVSVWASDWLRNHCELVDWLSFPMPATTETQGHLPPSLAAFCPWDGALLMYVGPGVYKEVIIYNLCQKQVVEKIPLPFFAMSLSLSPGTHLLAVGFAECMLRLVDCAMGTAQDFAGHDNAVHLCRFTPSARLLFTAARNEILVWEVPGL
ncbi:WD repeat-containing protein 90 isoform X2 [Homo sapiens]|uniref:WD repeat-containing protein 90 isoform X2 n=1 Tax=Homo sapiens TaxID=9606 RepID=UPI001FB14886|nr:WD repeat-containing protein 90 isoform X2 [Homo sapiens]XP_054235729.1 WD repeat-containing protein 90 isoform X2 [Homo sapiens]